MRNRVLISAAVVAATSLAVYGYRAGGRGGSATAPLVGGLVSTSGGAGGGVHVTDFRLARIHQANEPGCCDWVVMEDTDGTPLQVQIDLPVPGLAVIRLVGALRVGAPDRFQRELRAAIEIDGVVDEEGEVVARVAGVDPVFSTIEEWEQVATEGIALLAPGRHTISAVWRDSNNTTVSQANKMSLISTVYTATTSCASDGNGDGVVDFEDLLGVLVSWGPCPG